MTLRVRELCFPIKSATLSAVLPDPYWCDQYNGGHGKALFWCLDVRTLPVPVGDDLWEPSLYHESLHLAVPRWVDVVGISVSWASPFDERTGEPNGGFYLNEHEDIPMGTIAFGAREGLNFQVKWTGACNMFATDEFDDNVPFTLDALAKFEGIAVHGCERDAEGDLCRRLGASISLDGLVQSEPMTTSGRYNSGVRMRSKHFSPADDA